MCQRSPRECLAAKAYSFAGTKFPFQTSPSVVSRDKRLPRHGSSPKAETAPRVPPRRPRAIEPGMSDLLRQHDALSIGTRIDADHGDPYIGSIKMFSDHEAMKGEPTMSRKAMLASLAGAIAIGLAAFSAQAAPIVANQAGVRTGEASLVQPTRYRYHRYYRHHHRYWRHRHHRWY